MSGYGAKTLPVKIWETIRIEFTPAVAVAATVMIALAAVLFVVGRLISPSAEEARGR
jgi:putative spermidine/putrescine transport system permease protein